MDGGLNLGLLGVPVGPFGRAAGEVGEDAGVVGPHQLVEPARAEPQRLELAPLPVAAALAMRGLNHDLADGPALIDVDFVKDFLLAGGGRGGGRLLGERLPHFREAGLPVGGGDRSSGQRTRQGGLRRLEEIARAVLIVGEVDREGLVTRFGDKGRHVVGPDFAADVGAFVGGQDGGPQVLAG